MKKLILFTALAFFIQTIAFSQSCLPDGINFSTQAEIDNFQTNYPGCTEIEGEVDISGSDITNLAGLNVLTSIGGNFVFWYSNALVSMAGLENLTSVGGNLYFYQNDALVDLTGLNNLAFIGGDFLFFKNYALNSLTALNNLTYIGGHLDIEVSESLTSLAGLDNVTTILGGIYLIYNDSLTNLSALSKLTSIGGCLDISANIALSSLTGLDNLTSIGGHIWIAANDSLSSLTELKNITSIGGFLRIRYNNVLTSLSGLENIEAASIDSLYIHNNISLSTCEVQSICDYLSSPNGIIEIHDNATGCNTQEEVEYACGVGIPNLNPKSKISIYPNPTENEIFISGNNGIIINEVNIYNQIGQKVIHEKPITNSIDVSVLRQGMYIIELVTNNSRIREKLIIR